MSASSTNHVVFDLYGCLAHLDGRPRRNGRFGEHPYEGIYRILAEACGVDRNAVKWHLLKNPIDNLADVFKKFPPKYEESEIRRVLEDVRVRVEMANRRYRLDEDAERLLQLALQNMASVSILSNAAQFMDPEALLGRADRRVPRFFSYSVGSAKPEPAAFHAVSGTSSDQYVMIGDSWYSDVLGAVRSGWSAIYLAYDTDPIARALASAGGDILSIGHSPSGIAGKVFRALGLTHDPLQAVGKRPQRITCCQSLRGVEEAIERIVSFA